MPEERLPAVRTETAAELAPREVVQQVATIQRVMEAVMKDGEHYGKIPGCGDKKVLFKAGAEKLTLTFRLAPAYEVTRTDLANGHREYEVRCRLTHINSGHFLGEGVGCCTSMESKYRYRKGAGILCPDCDQPLRRGEREWYCWDKKGGCGAKFSFDDEVVTGQAPGRTENPDIADVYNTVLKMAKKRAYVDATITATSASDIFTQDIGDPEGDKKPGDGPRDDPRAKQAGEVDAFIDRTVAPEAPKGGDEQWKKLAARLEDLGIIHDDAILKLADAEGIKRDRLDDLTAADLNVLEKAATRLERREGERSGAARS